MKKVINLIFSILFILIAIYFVSNIWSTNILPTKYIVLLSVIMLLVLIITIILINKKSVNLPLKIISYVINVVMSIMMVLGIYYVNNVMNFLKNTVDQNIKTENYVVLVLDSSSYKNITQLESKNIGYVNNEATNIELALSELKKKITFNQNILDGYNSLVNSLKSTEIEAMLIEEATAEILKEEITDFENYTRIVHTFHVEIKTESIIKEVDVKKEPFNIYISGIDVYGKISSVSRSDVNIVVTVNPETNQILLTSIPRDYYVQLHGTTGLKDKLTHAGIYGVQMSVKTLEDLLDTDINYYARVNFSTLIKSIDVIGGVDVYSKYEFTSRGYHFFKGYNHMSGEAALAFSRERYSFADGDRMRGKNQQAVITAIISKVTSPTMVTKFNSILQALDGTFQTNMPTDKIINLVNMQIDEMPTWKISSNSLTGGDSHNYTYSYSGSKLYVMEPNKESINTAIELIKKVENGELLSDSTTGEASNIKDAEKVQTTKKRKTTTTTIPAITTTTTTQNIQTTTTVPITTTTTTEPISITTTTTTTKPVSTTTTSTVVQQQN